LTGVYKRSNILSLFKLLNGILIGFFINSSLTYFFNEYAFSRIVILRSTAYSYLFLASWRVILKMINFARQKNIFSTIGNTIIVGKNEDSERFLKKLKKRIEADYNILGYISTGNNTGNGYIGNLDNLRDIIVSNRIKNIIFAKSVLTNQQILDLMWNLKNFNLNYKILSSDSDIIFGKSPLDKIGDIYLMQIEYNINKKFNIFVKRIFDVVFGIFCLVFIYPFVRLYFRLNNTKSEDHKFLKKTALIPEVVKGNLSFVGRATWDTTSTGKQFLGKNGLTGLVQINYYKNLSIDEIEYYNYYYAKNQTLILDLEIFLKTISLFLFSKKVVKL
jgi:lipopolysaccharide/colanic/teichoic acid biosynthesis glycosyltransferase